MENSMYDKSEAYIPFLPQASTIAPHFAISLEDIQNLDFKFIVGIICLETLLCSYQTGVHCDTG